jgi:hypothetical protein
MDTKESIGTELQVHALTQGISPFEERAGAAEWQTSSVPRNECPSFIATSVNEDTGTRTVNARTVRRINATDLMVEV